MTVPGMSATFTQTPIYNPTGILHAHVSSSAHGGSIYISQGFCEV